MKLDKNVRGKNYTLNIETIYKVSLKKECEKVDCKIRNDITNNLFRNRGLKFCKNRAYKLLYRSKKDEQSG